jgi:hypothetical protein
MMYVYSNSIHNISLTLLSQTAADDTSMESDAVSVVDGSEGGASDSAHRTHTNHPSPRPVSPHVKSSKCVAAAKGKITGYWKVEMAAEKAVRLEKDAREYAERVRLREVEEKRKAILRAWESGNERMQRHRNRVCEEKIAGGWIPGKNKRVGGTAYSSDSATNFDTILEACRAGRPQ